MAEVNVPERLVRMAQRAEQALASDKAKAVRYVKLVHGVLPRKRAGRSNLVVRKAHEYVENSVARKISVMFQYQPWFDIEAKTQANVSRADKAEKVLQYYYELADLPTKCVAWFTQSTTEGLGIMKQGWKRLIREQKQRMPLDEAIAKVPKFKLPPELKDVHVFVSLEGDVARNEDGSMVEHEGDQMDEDTYSWQAQGFERVTLDMAPQVVQNAYTVVVKAPKVIYDGIDLMPIDFQDFFFDPDASSVEELRYAGHSFGRTLADLKEEKSSGIPYKNLSELETLAKSGAIPDLARYRRRNDIGKSNASDFDEDATLLKITELWHVQAGKLYAWVTTGNSSDYGYDGILIREEDIPYWHGELPYHLLPASIIPFELMGVGIPELIEHLINERNELRNIQMDVKTLAVMPPWLAATEYVKDLSKLRNLEPNRIIELENTEGKSLDQIVKQVTVDAAPMQNVEFLIRTIDGDMDGITGITKPLQGTPIGRRTTYSETSLLANEANQRFKLQIILIDRVMKRLAKQGLRLLDQYIDPQVEIRITNDQGEPAFIKADRADLAYEYDISPVTTGAESLANQLAQANQMVQLYGVLRGSPLEGVIKPAEFARELLRMAGLKNTNVFLKSDQELQAEQQQQMAMAQQGQPGGQPTSQGQPQGPPQDDAELQLIAQEHELILQQQMPPVEPQHNHELHVGNHQMLADEFLKQYGSEEEAQGDPRFVILVDHMVAHAQAQEGNGGQDGAPITSGVAQA